MNPATRRTLFVASAVALGTMLYTTGPLYRVRTWWAFEDPLASDTFVISVQIVVGAIAAAALVRHSRWRRVDPRPAIVAMALVGWLALSAIWSASPSTTLRESLLIGVALVAGAGAAVAAGERLLVIAAWIGIHLGLGWSAVLIALVRPNSQDANGEWTGVYFNPNSLALVAAFGILLAVVLLAMIATRRVPGLARTPVRVVVAAVVSASIVADLWLISGTGALTPLFGLVVALVVAGAAWVAQRFTRGEDRDGVDPRAVAAASGVVLVTLGLVAWFTRGSWLSSVGRTSELTGRTAMWDVSLDWFAKSPIVGQGYLGAWYDPQFVAEMLAARGEVLGTTHNSFIELLLGAGIVGFGLAIGLFALLWLAAGTRALTGRGVVATWPLAVLVYVLVENVGETLLVGGQLMVATTGALIVVSAARQPVPPASPPPRVDAVEAVGSERRS
ncbi:MAG TPA: O-antigen ligase family protein [Ilumatobacteraceae bacterium]|nr:O-antigen ligase family protein [Ilumatobacteraceae bacterium]